MVVGMAKDFEGQMAEALDAAADEAVKEFEAQSEDAEDEVDDAAEVEDDEDALEAPDEQSDEDEAETEDDEPADDEVEASAEDFEWDGNPETVPEELKPYYDKTYEVMRKGVDVWMSKKATAWDAERKQLQQRIAEMESYVNDQRQKALEPPVPTRPTTDDAEQWDSYYDARAKRAAWEQWQEQQKAAPQPDTQQIELLKQQQEALERANLIESQPGYTEDIGNKMVEVAQANPHWAALVSTKEGLMALFESVKNQVEAESYKKAAAEKNSAEIRRKATAAKRKVGKPKAASKKKASPARNWAEMSLDDAVEAAFAESLEEHGN